MSILTKNRKATLLAVLATASVLYLLLFHTIYGLWIQYRVSQRIQCSAYTRFLSSRFATNGDVRFRKLAAEMLMGLAGEDLYDAQRAWSAVIMDQPDARSHSARAYTYMHEHHYANAIADYEQAIKLLDPRDMTGNVNGRQLSNDLEMARVCAETQSNQSAHTN